MLQAYLDLTLEAISGHSAFIGQPNEFLGSALEMFIFRKCHERTWELALDAKKDEAVTERLDSLQFLNFDHLDIKCLSEASKKTEAEEEEGGEGRLSLSSTTSTGSAKSVAPPDDLWSVPLETLRQVDDVKSPVEKVRRLGGGLERSDSKTSQSTITNNGILVASLLAPSLARFAPRPFRSSRRSCPPLPPSR